MFQTHLFLFRFISILHFIFSGFIFTIFHHDVTEAVGFGNTIMHVNNFAHL
jgi:hypothetical protein